MSSDRGEVAERLKALASKASVRETVPWVRIPPSPPVILCQIQFLKAKAEHLCSACPNFGIERRSEMAGGYAALLQIFLVVFFGAPERACRCDLGGDGPLESAAGIERCACVLGLRFLLRRINDNP